MTYGTTEYDCCPSVCSIVGVYVVVYSVVGNFKTVCYLKCVSDMRAILILCMFRKV